MTWLKMLQILTNLPKGKKNLVELVSYFSKTLGYKIFV